MPKLLDQHGRPSTGQMPGLVEAIVLDNKDPDQMGRVKLKFPSLPEAPESFWARLVMPMAGKNRGWMTIPEIDDEVLVAFVQGHGRDDHAVARQHRPVGATEVAMARDLDRAPVRRAVLHEANRLDLVEAQPTAQVRLADSIDPFSCMQLQSSLVTHAGDHHILQDFVLADACSDVDWIRGLVAYRPR